VKGKVNQAMGCGIPVVATSASIEGIHAIPGEEILVADGARAFAEAIAKVYRDEAAWNRLSAGGLANVRKHFSPEVAEKALGELFELARRRQQRS
jgi:glycosyltransferase involved in cell wall biosynthesis